MCAGLLPQSPGIRVQGQPQESRKWHMRNLAARRLSWTSENGLFGVVDPWDCLRLRSSTTAVLSHRFRCRSPLACRGPRPPPSLPNPPAPCPSVYSGPLPASNSNRGTHSPKTQNPPQITTSLNGSEPGRSAGEAEWGQIKLLANGGGTLGARAGGVRASDGPWRAHDTSGGDARCQALRWRNPDGEIGISGAHGNGGMRPETTERECSMASGPGILFPTIKTSADAIFTAAQEPPSSM
jgi:hypothetical protein